MVSQEAGKSLATDVRKISVGNSTRTNGRWCESIDRFGACGGVGQFRSNAGMPEMRRQQRFLGKQGN